MRVVRLRLSELPKPSVPARSAPQGVVRLRLSELPKPSVPARSAPLRTTRGSTPRAVRAPKTLGPGTLLTKTGSTSTAVSPQPPVEMVWTSCVHRAQSMGLSPAVSQHSEKLWTLPIVSHTRHSHDENAFWGSPQIHSTTTTTTLL